MTLTAFRNPMYAAAFSFFFMASLPRLMKRASLASGDRLQSVVPNPPSTINANTIRLRLFVFVAIRITWKVKEARRLPQSRLLYTVHRARHAAHHAKSFPERKISCKTRVVGHKMTHYQNSR